MKRINWLILFLLLAMPAVARAEPTVYLKDGSVLHGDVVGTVNGVVTIQTKAGKISVEQSAISRIDYGGATAAPTAAPAATPNPWTTVPEETPAPRPYATPASQPGAAAGPTFDIAIKVGAHSFQGSGWSAIDKVGNRNDFISPAIELSAPIGIALDQIAVQLVPTVGRYSGSGTLRDAGGNTATFDATTLYMEAGPRIVLGPGPAQVYAQAGLGVYQGTIELSSGGLSDSNDRTGISVHALVGASIAATPAVRVFAELKGVNADGKYPHATDNLDMGGYLALVGLSFRLSH